MPMSIVVNSTEPLSCCTGFSQHALKPSEGPAQAWHRSQETTVREESECVGANCTVIYFMARETRKWATDRFIYYFRHSKWIHLCLSKS